MKSALNLATAPRAILGSPCANATPADMIRQLHSSFDDFRTRNEARLDGLEAGLNDMNVRSAARDMNGGGRPAIAPDPEYTGLYAGWMRTGSGEEQVKAANATGRRGQIQAAMSVGNDNSGGYTAPVEWDRRVGQALTPLSPMRQLATVVQTTVRGYSTLWRGPEAPGSAWVGETAARPQTTTPTLLPINFTHGEIYANPAITQQLLDDADFPIEQWLSDQVADEFARQEGLAFINGDGVNKPTGLLTYAAGGINAASHPGGAIAVVPTGDAASLGSPDSLIDFIYGHPLRYRTGAKWLMASSTAAVIAKMKDGDGNYLWRETYVAGQPATLLGYEVVIDDTMPAIGAGALPIAFGDFRRAYVINDRAGVRVLRDPYSAKPYVMFYSTKRVGGGLQDPNAVRFLQIGA